MKRINIFLIVIVVFLGCADVQSKADSGSHKDSTTVAVPDTVNTDPDGVDCIVTIKNFLSWYQKNYEAINSIQLINLNNADTTGFYRVNFDSTTRYLSYLKQSGYFSETFLANQLEYFKKADQQFVKTRQNDGPAEGFDTDLLLFTQEPETILQKESAVTIKEVQSGQFKIRSIDHSILVGMSIKNHACLIDKLDFSKN